MSTSDDPPAESRANPPALTERVVAFEREDGAVVVYDEHDHTAWLRSNAAVTITDAR